MSSTLPTPMLKNINSSTARFTRIHSHNQYHSYAQAYANALITTPFDKSAPTSLVSKKTKPRWLPIRNLCKEKGQSKKNFAIEFLFLERKQIHLFI